MPTWGHDEGTNRSLFSRLLKPLVSLTETVLHLICHEAERNEIGNGVHDAEARATARESDRGCCEDAEEQEEMLARLFYHDSFLDLTKRWKQMLSHILTEARFNCYYLNTSLLGFCRM